MAKKKLDLDATIRVPAPARPAGKPARNLRRVVPVVVAGFMVLGVAATALNMWRNAPAPLPPQAAVVPVVPPAPEFSVTFATESEIMADQPSDMTVFRFKSNPAIVVLDFASLAEQGQMLNRMAVFEEKDGYPHDRLLSDAELDAAIHAGGDEPATFYYGHDYRAAALVSFFKLAERDNIPLTGQEMRLGRLIAELGWTAPNAVGALITLPRLGADATVDAGARATILRHELSHGEYFTSAEYAAFCQRFWRDIMTDADRAGFRRFLIADHYDGAIEDLMINEGQAYLMHTHDPRFFSAQFVGLTPSRIEQLRQMFMAGMPRGWLREATLPSAATITPASAAGSRAPRRRRAGRPLRRAA